MAVLSIQQLAACIHRLFSGKSSALSFPRLFEHFQSLIAENNRALEIMADMGEKQGGEFVFDRKYITTSIAAITESVYRMIYHLDCMAPKQFHGLFPIYNRIRRDLESELSGQLVIPEGDYVISCNVIDDTLETLVGGKNAHLGIAANILGLTIPPGFAISSRCFDTLLRNGPHADKIQSVTDMWQARQIETSEASARLTRLILSLELPKTIRKAIEREVAVLALRFLPGTSPRFAVRSSAIGEDSEHSYAGQFESLLHVEPDGVIEAYKKVLASLYSPQAMEYRRTKNIKEAEAVMAVCCQAMVPAQTSGVAYSLDIFNLEENSILVTAVNGLGAGLVGGEQHADSFRISRKLPHEVTGMEIVHKTRILQGRKEGSGVSKKALDASLSDKPSLKQAQLQEVAEAALMLESYFKHPQDIEFAFDTEGKLIILQTRALNIEQSKPQLICDLSSLADKFPVLMEGKGEIVQKGVAMGCVHLVHSEDDLVDVPRGSILVAHYSSPNLARTIRRVSGIITDIGSPIGHLSTISREFRVPMIINAGDATKRLKNGSEITLDANDNKVYGGLKNELCYYEFTEETVEETYEYRLLRRLLKKISPLILVDPSAKNFTPKSCKTLHDLIRYVHEQSVKVLIQKNYVNDSYVKEYARKLDLEIPLDLTVIDFTLCYLDNQKKLTRENINNVALKHFADGMCIPGLWARDPVSVDMKSFMSSMTRTFSASIADPQMIGQNLAVASGDYLNVSLRLGYHFSMIDTICSDKNSDNYIYFRFFGGVTEQTRRSRRAQLVQQLLSLNDFMTSMKGDLVVGRIKGASRQIILEKVFILGALVSFTRQLDVRMINDNTITQFANSFQSILENLQTQQPEKTDELKQTDTHPVA